MFPALVHKILVPARHLGLACFLACLALIGCNKGTEQDEGKLVATFGEERLYDAEIVHFMPAGLTPEDSTLFRKEFIRKWVRGQAIRAQAQKVVGEYDRIVAYKGRDYEMKLAEYLLGEWAIHTRLDTVVQRSEIENYYHKHPDKFVAEQPYYSFFYFTSENLNPYKEIGYLRSDDEEKRQKLREWCKENATSFWLDSTYLSETGLEPAIRSYPGNLKIGAREGRTYSFYRQEEDKRLFCAFKLLDRLETGTELPLKMCEPRIKGIILNQRKQRVTEQLIQELVQKANTSKNFQLQ
ncbi:MAG: hypothetical protein AAGI38_03160 [Bacteroidota bacterium]